MPWRKRKSRPGSRRALLLALAAAALGGVLASLLGVLLHQRGSALYEKYSAYKSITGNYPASEIKTALEKRGAAAP